MRKGFGSLALLVQEEFKRDPHAGDLWVFRGRRGDLIKVVWHDGQGACLFTKRLERGRFLWPSIADGVVTISAAQLSYLLSGIDWRAPRETWRPTGGRIDLECLRRIDSRLGLRAIFSAESAEIGGVRGAADSTADGLPGDLASAHAMILAQRELLAAARSEAKTRALEIERLKLQLAKARHERFGQSSERGKLIAEQLELRRDAVAQAR